MIKTPSHLHNDPVLQTSAGTVQNFYFCNSCCHTKIVDLLNGQQKILERIVTTVVELEQKLNDINAQLSKASVEIQAEVKALQDVISANGQLSPGAEQALANLSAIAQSLDDRTAG